jgi:hypothetical protein
MIVKAAPSMTISSASAEPRDKDANHPPVVSVRGPLDLTAAPGTVVHLSGSATMRSSSRKPSRSGSLVVLRWN